MKNIGWGSWTARGGYKLGSLQPLDNTFWGLNRVELSPGEAIRSGDVKTFQFQITTPVPEYDTQQALAWRMVQVQVEWFGQSASSSPYFIEGTQGAEPGPCDLKPWLCEEPR